MRIAICDDDRQERDDLLAALRGWDASRQAECFSDGAALLEAAGRKPPFTIAFLDIYMPGQSGLEVAKALQRISPQTGIVFVTTSRDHAVDAFSLHAVHYLIKPVTVAGIREAFARVQKLQRAQRPVLTVKAGRNMQTLYLDEIMTLASADHKVTITLKNGQEVTPYGKLRDLRDQLDDNFLLVQRGLMVNMECIQEMHSDSFLMRDGQTFLMSRANRPALRQAYRDYLLRRQHGDGKEQ